MRLVSVILFLFLLVKSSVGMSLMQMVSSDCCSTDTTELMDDNKTDKNEDSEHNGCCGLDCDCICCVHIWITDTADMIEETDIPTIYDSPILFQNNYIMSYQNKIWHPPCGFNRS